MRYSRVAALLAIGVGVFVLGFLRHIQVTVQAADATAAQTVPDQVFHDKIIPVLARHCYECHGNGHHEGKLALDSFKSVADIQSHGKQWESVLKTLRGGYMPPPAAKSFPSFQEQNAVADWIRDQLSANAAAHPDPGPTVVHRLTRIEYLNTIKDLVGVDFKPTDDFPIDETLKAGVPSSNVGILTPELKEKYLDAGSRIIELTIIANADQSQPLPAALAVNFTVKPTTTKTSAAREILGNFTLRAWRRPVKAAELDNLMSLFASADKKGASFDESLKSPMKAVLASPEFLFRGTIQSEAADNKAIHPLNEYQLASRLSYFIWSSMPDTELFDLAERGQLREQLAAQVKRMIASPKSRALVENFSGQWLQTKDLAAAQPDKNVFPEYEAELRNSMEMETRGFFNAVMRDDRSVLDFLNGNYTFVNQRLAEFYGIQGVKGDQFQKVSLDGTPRRGVLTQAGVLIVANFWYHNRTSVTSRGKWVMKNFLNLPGSTPLEGAPPLPNVGHPDSGTLRKQLEQHRASQACMYCHIQIDPLGFALENFDGIGKWRDKEGVDPVDASAQLPTGEPFNGAVQLVNILAKNHHDQFIEGLASKMLGYALGRPVTETDQPAVEQIVAGMRKNDLKFSSLVMGIVDSMPFQMRRAEFSIPAQP